MLSADRGEPKKNWEGGKTFNSAVHSECKIVLFLRDIGEKSTLVYFLTSQLLELFFGSIIFGGGGGFAPVAPPWHIA